MKTFLSVLVLLVTLVSLSVGTFAQSKIGVSLETIEGDRLISVDPGVSIAGVDTVQTYAFTLGEYNGVDSVICFVELQLGSSTGVPRIKGYLRGFFDESQTYLVNEFTAYADTSESYRVGAVDFGSTIYPYYYIELMGYGTNPSDALVNSIKLFLIKKEY